MNNPFMQWNGNSYEVLSYIERIPTILLGLLTYLKLIIWPWPLTHDYYPLQLPIISYSDYRMYLSLLLYGGLTFWAFKKIKASNIAAWGWLWFIVALFPMSNILINVGTFLSERFLFISSLGFAMIVSYFLFSQAATRRLSPGIRTGIGIAVITLYVIAVGLRMPAWKSNFTLFTTDVETSKNSAKVNNAAAGEYNRVAGLANSTEEQKMWARKALPKSNRALELHPTYKNAFLQKGNAYFYLRDYETAIEQYKNCLQLDPNDPDANSNLALAYRSAGQYYGEEKQDLSSAVRYLNKAYEMNPNDYETLRLLGVAYGFSGRSDQAIRFFKQALQMKAGEARSYYNLGAAYMQNGQLDSGQVYMERAKEIDPSLFEKNDGE
jgi:tetratricopeptide (TPR) repeat protein